jgi:SynChlorMet cassette radical SAM/SPASM protein ScmE
MSEKDYVTRIVPTPRSLEIAITGRCNLSCAYCYYADEMTARKDLPTQAWLDFFARLGELKVMKVCLTGGEVFTRPDFFQLVDGVIANRMRYQVLSNGTLITEKTLAEFEQGKRRQRLDSIQISIDGSSAEVHDQSRPNSFARALHGLKLLNNAGYPMTVRVTINRFNFNDLNNTARLLFDEVGLPSFTTNEAYPCGATNRYEAGIMLSVEQRREVMDTLTKLNQKYPNRISANAGPLVLARDECAIHDARGKGETSFKGRGFLTACGGVFEKLAVLHDGTIVPCNVISDMRLGNILENDLGEIWKNHPMLQELRRRGEISLDELTPCKDCDYKGYCTGGCPGGALFLNGDFNTRNPTDCYRILLGEEPYSLMDVRKKGEKP